MPLTVQNVTKAFGGVVALQDVSIPMMEGEVTAVIGGNGAGKSTLFNVIAGYVRPDRGRVHLSRPGVTNGSRTELTRMAPHRIAQTGIGVLFQSVRVFDRLTVADNVLAGFPAQPGEGLIGAIFGLRESQRTECRNVHEAMSLLHLVGLEGKAAELAGNVSFGEQKLVAIARLLAANARVLLLDEPTSGVHPAMVEQLLSLIRRLAHDESRVVVLIEHNPKVVDQVADRVFALDRGVLVDSTRFSRTPARIEPTSRLP